MQRRLLIKSKPFSLNAATYKDASIKTTEYRQWAAMFFHELSKPDNQQKLKDLREYFDENKHSFKIILKAIYPKAVYITKAGILSSKTIDTTNWEKLVLDLLFDPRFHDTEYPYGAPNVNANDKHVVSMLSQKSFHESDESLLDIKIKIVPRAF